MQDIIMDFMVAMILFGLSLEEVSKMVWKVSSKSLLGLGGMEIGQ